MRSRHTHFGVRFKVGAVADIALAQDQVVYAPGYDLYRLMNALEVMDPTMDNGMVYPPHLLDETDRVDDARAMEPADPLPLDAVCFVFDRLLALELAWLQGAALSQTLLTSVYYHTYVVQGKRAHDHWTHAFLSITLLATAKTCTLQWNELMRHHVLDGEDFHGEIGAAILPTEMDVDAVLAELDSVDMRIGDEASEDVAQAVCTRLAFCRAWLVLTSALCTTPPDCAVARAARESCIKSWQDLHPKSASTLPLQSPHLRTAPKCVQGYFDVRLSRVYSSHIPLRPLALPPVLAVWDGWERVLQTDVALPLRLCSSDEVMAWLALLQHTARAFETHAVVPFVRSLVQTYLREGGADGTERPADFMAHAVVEACCGRSLENVSHALEWHTEQHPASALLVRTARFLRTFSSLLVQQFSTFAMNRARQKRMFAKAYAPWADLADEAARLYTDLHPVLQDRVPMVHRSVQAGLLLQAIESLGAGFDLALYAEHEQGAMYFVLAKLYAEQHAVWSDLAAAYPVPSTHRAKERAHACSHLCSAYAMLLLAIHARRVIPATKKDAAYAEAAFGRRLKWLRRPAWAPPASLSVLSPSDDPEPIAVLWSVWQTYARDFCANTAREATRQMLVHVHACAQHSEAALTHLAADPWAALCQEECTAADAGLRTLCTQLETFLDARLQQRTPWSAVRFRASAHPWFPMPEAAPLAAS